jgi:hypothetical protein
MAAPQLLAEAMVLERAATRCRATAALQIEDTRLQSRAGADTLRSPAIVAATVQFPLMDHAAARLRTEAVRPHIALRLLLVMGAADLAEDLPAAATPAAVGAVIHPAEAMLPVVDTAAGTANRSRPCTCTKMPLPPGAASVSQDPSTLTGLAVFLLHTDHSDLRKTLFEGRGA